MPGALLLRLLEARVERGLIDVRELFVGHHRQLALPARAEQPPAHRALRHRTVRLRHDHVVVRELDHPEMVALGRELLERGAVVAHPAHGLDHDGLATEPAHQYSCSTRMASRCTKLAPLDRLAWTWMV